MLSIFVLVFGWMFGWLFSICEMVWCDILVRWVMLWMFGRWVCLEVVDIVIFFVCVWLYFYFIMLVVVCVCIFGSVCCIWDDGKGF